MTKLDWEQANRRDAAKRPDREKKRISAWADKILGLKGPEAPTRVLRTGEVILPPKVIPKLSKRQQRAVRKRGK